MTSAAGISVSSMTRTRRVAVVQRARAVDHEGRQRDDEQDLAQLGGLEGEEAAASIARREPRATEPSAETARIEAMSSP